MRKYQDWEEDEYRSFKKPKRVADKDKLGKHRKAIYDMLDNEFDEDYFDEAYSDEEYDEVDDRY